MPRYVSAKEFRQRFSEIVEDLKRTGEIVVLKRSKPLFNKKYPGSFINCVA
jgi:antitoxin (DNA-binding transcriptional repressor) of toxin-antitoxin stability system